MIVAPIQLLAQLKIASHADRIAPQYEDNYESFLRFQLKIKITFYYLLGGFSLLLKKSVLYHKTGRAIKNRFRFDSISIRERLIHYA